MTRTLLIPSLLLVATVATTTQAHAADQWVEGQSVTQNGSCVSGIIPAVESWVGFVNDPVNPLKTGDVNYIHAVAKNTGCTADGNNFEVFLPVGASLAIDAAHKVFCLRESTTGGSNPVLNCLQSPFIGPNGGYMFVSSLQTTAPGWYLEFQIPVVYNHELTAAGGSTHSLGVITSSTFGNLFPVRPVTVAYRPQMLNLLATGITGISATVGLNLWSYYAPGTVAFEYGTTPSLGMSTNPAAVSTTYPNFPNVSATLPNLMPSTTYYWQARFVTTANGMFVTPMQTFTTAYVPTVSLTVAKAGRGLGKVTSNPSGIDCGSYSSNACSLNVPQGTMVSLTATPSSGMYTFVGWSGACTGTGACTVPMTAAASVTATFEIFDTRTAQPIPGPTPPRRL